MSVWILPNKRSKKLNFSQIPHISQIPRIPRILQNSLRTGYLSDSGTESDEYPLERLRDANDK